MLPNKRAINLINCIQNVYISQQTRLFERTQSCVDYNALYFLVCAGFGLPSSHMHGPSFLEEPPASLEFTNSSGTILNCVGQGNPMPDVRWVDITDKEVLEVPKLR